MSSYEVILAQFRAAQQLHAQGDLAGALAQYDAILAAKPDLEEVHTNKGVVLRDLEQLEDALESFNRAIEINPTLVEGYNNRGFTLTELGRLSEALIDLDHAITLRPDFPDAHNNRGVALRRLNRLPEALQSYDCAIALNPLDGEPWNNRGEVYDALQNTDAAIESFQRALSLMPRDVDTLLNCALSLQKKQRFREAQLLLDRAAHINPGHKLLLFATAYGALQSCNWALQDLVRERLSIECATGKSIVAPLALLGYVDDPQTLRVSAARYLKHLVGPHAFAPAKPALIFHDKIKIAYFSSDFHEHATAYLIADLIERHDRFRFEVHGFSFGPNDQGETRQRLMRAFDHFHDVQSCGDAKVVALARQLEIDIAIDLKGFTSGERPGIFTRRAAPIQVNFLGYPGTMAADSWDYIIADSIVLPRAEQVFYSEKIVHLDCCYQPNARASSFGTTSSRAGEGLPDQGFVFCCFNNHSKITRPIFEAWMHLLKAIPNSVLWLLDGAGSDALRSEARARGVDAGRLIMAHLSTQKAHIARLRFADLVLDTLPYNAHTTASDALWAEVPIITCRGVSFAGRVAASLLTAIHLPELITEDLAAYEALALKFAQDESYRESIRKKLSLNKHAAPLFEENRFRLNIESAYSTMIKRLRTGEEAVGFDVNL